MKKLQFIIYIVIFTTLITGCFNLDTKNVNGTIQEKIDNSNNGDIIIIKSGIYNEKLIINKSITLIGESKNNTIIDYKNIENGNHIDIIIINANNCTIKGFTITNSKISSDAIGININSSNNNIVNNSISRTNQAIHLNYKSKNNKIYNNNIFDNQIGITLSRSYNNNISKNNIYLNSVNGINIDSLAENNLFILNNITNNKYGIHFTEGMLNTVFKNYFINNQRGIYLCCGARNNTLYNNFFKQNSESNARDVTDNQWYFNSTGNYWDDYIGFDENKDGLGDIPYNISGGSSIDLYPLINPP